MPPKSAVNPDVLIYRHRQRWERQPPYTLLNENLAFNTPPQRQPRCILDNHLLGLLVKLDPANWICFYVCLVQQLVHFRIRVVGVVDRATRPEKDIHKRVRIRVVGLPCQRERLQAVPVKVLQERCPLDLLNLYIDA